ncbi:MAG: acyltransferase [Dysgonomonas sp.]
MIIFVYIYKAGRKVIFFFRRISWFITYLKFKLNGVNFSADFESNGVPVTSISLKSTMTIGRNFKMNNGLYNNMIGRQQPCFFVIDEHCELTIGDNVGISGTAIICRCKIMIDDNVRIGGGTVIYDSDFHSLDTAERIARPEIIDNVKKAPVHIKKNTFIGAHSTILKGVVIGENSIVGACSVVTKSIPENEVWAGNPAKFIRKIK